MRDKESYHWEMRDKERLTEGSLKICDDYLRLSELHEKVN